jgi:hypothetical protein
VPKLSIHGSGTPLEKEMRTIASALERVAPSDDVFDRSAHDPKLLEMLAEQWRQRMIFEHRSSTVFSQLASQLFEAGSTLDAKIVMLRMAQDELRHTETCARVIEALGGTPDPEYDTAVQPLATHAGVSLQERALRNVIYTTCCSEMVACGRFVATMDRTKDGFLRDAMRRLLADEVLHGQFGFHYLTAWKPWMDEHPDVVRSIERYLVHAFAILEEELAPKPPLRAPASTAIELGSDDMVLAREVFYATLEGAVVPGLEQLGIGATASWRDRRRLI